MTEKGCLQIILISLIGFVICILIIIGTTLILLPNLDLSDKNSIIEICKNFTQTIFFITTATVALLSYFQAKKGLFNPLRTEIFKAQLEQIKSFEPLFETINSKSDIEEHYGLENILAGNTVKLIKEYFDNSNRILSIDEHTFIQAFKLTRNRRVSNKFSMLEYYEPQPSKPWLEEEVHNVHITDNFENIQIKLKELSSSSLVTSELKKVFLDLYQEGENLISVISKELHKTKPLIKDYIENLDQGDQGDQIDQSIITSKINLGEIGLYCKYKKASTEIEDYLQINNLLK